MSGAPAAEVDLGPERVAALVSAQHPDLADRPLRRVAEGWDNVTYRLGAGLAVRLPKREVGASLLRHEQRWLPELAPSLPLAVPVPLRRGEPGGGYPWPWSIVPWFEGEVASVAAIDAGAVARELVELFGALHVPAPTGAPRNPARGVPLVERRPGIEAAVARLGAEVDAHAVRARWEECEAAPPWPGPPCWIHGDLHPANLLGGDGRLVAVLDWGDVGAGDPATDLAAAWTLLGDPERGSVLAAAGQGDPAIGTRARGWALAVGLATWAGSAPGSAMASVGRRMVEAALGAGAE